VDRSQRRFLACLTLVAGLCALAQALTGVPELVLYLTPVFLLAALLLSGHYVAEDQIVEHWRGADKPPARRIRTRWVAARQLPIASLLERSPASPRGPPALVSPTV
jgi:hypothetical protein